jgi:2-oxoglutarate ferredoxin oxidoreductase subunit gamma
MKVWIKMKGKNARHEIILAGSGGQGLVVSGIMLAEAAMLEGKNVVQTQSYGIASRGGFSKAEVIIDKEEIIFQNVEEPDIVLVLTEEAMEMYCSLAESEIQIFYDTTFLKSRAGESLYGYPFTEMARELGHVGVANTIALGAMATRTHMVKTQSLELVLKRRFSEEVAAINIEGLKMGIERVSQL